MLLFGSAFYCLTMTQAGLQMDIQFAEKFLPGKLTIGKIQGKLFSQFELRDIFYRSDAADVQIKLLGVTWNPVGLLLHKLMFHSLKLDDAIIFIKKIDTDSEAHPPSFSYLRDITFEQAFFNRISLRILNTRIDLNGTVQKDWNISWKATIPQLNMLLPDSKGSLMSDGKISGPFLTPTLKAIVQGQKLAYGEQKIARLDMDFNIIVQPKINSSITLSATGISWNQSVVKKLNADIIGNVVREKKMINARFTGTLKNLAFLSDLIPELKEPSGALQINVFMNGTLAKPEIGGSFNLSNGKVRLPLLGITLEQIQLQGSTTTAKQLDFTGRFRSGKGIAETRGAVDFNNPDIPIILQLTGKELQAIHLPEYNILISPNVTLQFVKQKLQLQGTIFVPYAQITPKNFSSSITLPNEVVFVDSKKTIQLPFTTELQLTLQLGDKIHLAYENLEANLGGNIQINQLPGALVNAIGELYTKNGTYTAYGQTLTIQTGRLIYTGGSLMNPGLNISAVKQLKTVNAGGNVSSFTGQTSLQAVYTGAQNITVGVDVAGTLERPSFTLFSIPSMSQGDILSYLVFGFPQSQANGNQYGAILSALSSLSPGTSNMGNFTKGIEQKFGLTQLGVESVQVFNPNATSSTNSVVSTTSFVVGKQLSDNLSIHYSIGLFYPVSILNLRYKLTKHWAIQSETSTIDNGADLLYSIERD